jgi:hypothetical protein
MPRGAALRRAIMNNIRRFIFLALILVFAGSISWWSARSEAKVAHHIQVEVDKLVPRFIADPTSIQSLLADPILEPVLALSLQHVVLTSNQKNKNIIVIVTDGDNLLYGDGSATHVAVLEIDHQPVAGLRIICSSENDPLVIAGVFSGSTEKANTQ